MLTLGGQHPRVQTVLRLEQGTQLVRGRTASHGALVRAGQMGGPEAVEAEGLLAGPAAVQELWAPGEGEEAVPRPQWEEGGPRGADSGRPARDG